MGDGDECEHEVLAHPTEDWWCVSGYNRLFNKADLMGWFTLIRKGPKVCTFEGVEWTRSSGDNSVIFPVFMKPIMETIGDMIDNGKSYDMTLTERTTK